jgi:hypothetical protein
MGGLYRWRHVALPDRRVDTVSQFQRLHTTPLQPPYPPVRIPTPTGVPETHLQHSLSPRNPNGDELRLPTLRGPPSTRYDELHSLVPHSRDLIISVSHTNKAVAVGLNQTPRAPLSRLEG